MHSEFLNATTDPIFIRPGQFAKGAAMDRMDALPDEKTRIEVREICSCDFVESHNSRFSVNKNKPSTITVADGFPLIIFGT